MAPTESNVLTKFLLSPSPLPTIISLQKFTECFPKSQRTNSQIKILYRELQHIRSLDDDQVKHNIVQEVKKGERQRREVVRARNRAVWGDVDGVDGREMETEATTSGAGSNHPTSKPHTLSTILPAMEEARADIQAEIDALEVEARAILDDIRTTVGDLSDLRYGRFDQQVGSWGDLRGDVLEGLEGLEEVCRILNGQ